MRTLLVLLALIVLLFVGVGLYRGWFKASASVSVDEAKFESDKDKVLEKIDETTRTTRD